MSTALGIWRLAGVRGLPCKRVVFFVAVIEKLVPIAR